MVLTAHAGVLAGPNFPLLTLNGSMITTGNVFFASSTAALRSNDNEGNRPELPKLTIQAAVRACAAKNTFHF